MVIRHARRTVIGLALACVAAAPAPAGRPAKEIAKDLSAVDRQIADQRHPDSAKYDPQNRPQMAALYGPLYRSRQTLLAEYAAAIPKTAAAIRHLSAMDDARLAFWGDDAAKARLDAAVADADPLTATDGKLGNALVGWWSASGDADGQAKVVADVEQLAAAQPTSPAVADAVHQMLLTSTTTVAIGHRLTTDLTVKLARTPLGKSYAAVANKIDEPLAIEGTTLAGQPFKSSALAGKVVLLDFWATWHPPCRDQIPQLAKVYEQYHAQGLEIVGISSDHDKRVLTAFLKEHPEVPWPELFAGGSGWHPLTKKFGITALPTLYLIDRHGNLRTTDAESGMDKLIPELLAEPYTAPVAKAKPTRPVAPPPGSTAQPTGAVPPDAIHDALRRAAGATMH